MSMTDIFYDNVDKKDYLQFLLLTTTRTGFVAEEIRWLKKVEIIPNNKCCCCNKEEIGTYEMLCYECKKKEFEIDILREHIKKQGY